MPPSDNPGVLLTGATGLVGQGVLAACLESADIGRVVALVRRPQVFPGRTEPLVLGDFLQAEQLRGQLQGLPVCFYCAGAPPVGTAEAEYRRVTVDTTLAVARAWGADNPDGTFFYVSGAFADPKRCLMPLRVKGEIENALRALPVRSVMLRPGGVYPVAGTGTSHGVLKPLYTLGGPVMRLAIHLLPSMMTSNRAIGRTMIAVSRSGNPPPIIECAQINTMSR